MTCHSTLPASRCGSQHKEKARGDDAIGSRPDSFAPELVDVLRQVRAIIAQEKK